MKTMYYDIEVAFQPEITEMAIRLGFDEKKLSYEIDANMRYISHISYAIDNGPVVDLSLLDYKGSIRGGVNEKQLLIDFSKAYNSCTHSVAHYGRKFDIRFINSRLAHYSLPPLKPIKLSDTWRLLKDNFILQSNRLDTAIKFFNCPYGKPSLQWNVWRGVSLGNLKDHKILRHRCRYDVKSLRWIYINHLRGFDKGLPNKSIEVRGIQIDEADVKQRLKDASCPRCKAKGSLKREGYAFTKTATKQQLSCTKCFGWPTAPIKRDGTLGVIQ